MCRYMLTTRVAGVFGVSGMECEPVPFGLEGQLGGFVVRPVSMPATFTQPCWEKGRAAMIHSALPQVPQVPLGERFLCCVFI